MPKLPQKYCYPRGRRDLTLRPVGGEFSLYDASGRRTEPLSLRAALIWTYCDGRHHVDAITQALVGNLPESGGRDAVRQEVAHALRQFADHGLLS